MTTVAGVTNSSTMEDQLPPGVLQLTRQLDEAKIQTLTQKYDSMRVKNEALRTRIEKSEKGTHEFLAYFQQELEQKDKALTRLSETLALKEAQVAQEQSTTKATFEAKIKEVTEAAQVEQSDLKSKVSRLDAELSKLDEFREMQHGMERQIGGLESEIETSKRAHNEKLREAERSWLAEKSQLQREMDLKTEQLRKDAKLETQHGLDEDVRKIIADNRRMGEELRFQQHATAELQATKVKAEREATALKRELALSRDKEAEYARQRRAHAGTLKKLNERVAELESGLRDAGHAFTKERADIRKGLRNELEEHTLDAAGLRQLLRLKNTELTRLRRVAKTVLDQRSEVEQFFLASLDECRTRIRDDRTKRMRESQSKYDAELKDAMQSGGRVPFPKIRGGRDKRELEALATEPSRLPLDASQKVNWSHLTWEDRERVLRLLFAKINAVHKPLPAMPPHPLDESNPQE